jgi:hypothetical protein
MVDFTCTVSFECLCDTPSVPYLNSAVFVIGARYPQTRCTDRSFYGGNNAYAPQI